MRPRRAVAVTAATLLVAAAAYAGFASGPRPHVDAVGNPVILVSVETLRPDRLSVNGYDRNVTPNIDAFINRSVYFSEAYAGSTWTLPSQATVMSGEYPSETGVMTTDQYLCPREVTFAEVAWRNGYYTAASTGGGHAGARYNLDQGFEDYRELYFFTNVSISHRYHGSSPVAQVPPNASKFLLFVQGFDVRLPYLVPRNQSLRWGTSYDGDIYTGWSEVREDYRSLSAAERRETSVVDLYLDSIDVDGDLDPQFNAENISRRDRRFLQDMYDNGLYHADRSIGRLFDRLRERGLYERSTIILYASHGEELGEHGSFQHYSPYQEVMRVPLAVKYPNQTSREVVDRRVEVRDIYPTVLRLVGAGYDGSAIPLQAVEAGARHDTIFAEDVERRMLIDGRYKLVAPLEGEPSLFDLGADPDESRDLVDERPGVVQRLRAALARYPDRDTANACSRTE